MSGPMAFYNEIDPFAAHLLRTLIAENVIAPGVVDERSIKDIQPDDLRDFTQVHLFAGGGLWSVAARLAGWPDDEPLWTGSCPCQPFSQAGQGRGVADKRHLWPDMARLLDGASRHRNRPPPVVGEQVAGKAGYDWFNGVSADLAKQGYGARVVDIPACAVDAPHIRQRLYWVAVANSASAGRDAASHAGIHRSEEGRWSRHGEPHRLYGAVDMADRTGTIERRHSSYTRGAAIARCGQAWPTDGHPAERGDGARGIEDDNSRSGATLGDAFEPGLEGHGGHGDGATGRTLTHRPASAADGCGRSSDVADRPSSGWQQGQPAAETSRHGREPSAAHRPNASFWSDHDWIGCHDGKARRTKPGLRLLVNGASRRVDQWRVAGNAIVVPEAVEVLKALREVMA